MVKRWEMDWTKYDNDAYMKDDPDGEYVYYEDYAKLESALRECVEAIESDCQNNCHAPDEICLVCGLGVTAKKAREVLGDA